MNPQAKRTRIEPHPPHWLEPSDPTSATPGDVGPVRVTDADTVVPPGAAGVRSRGPLHYLRSRRDLMGRRVIRSGLRRWCRVGVLVVVDLVAVTTASILTIHWTGLAGSGAGVFNGVLFVAFLTVLSLAAHGMYREARGWRNLGRTVSAALVASLGCVLALYADPRLSVTLLLAAGGTAILAGTLVTGRFLIRSLVEAAYRRGIGLRRVIVIGDPEDLRDVTARFDSDHGMPTTLVGYVSPAWTESGAPGALGGLSSLRAIIEEHDVRHVVVSAQLTHTDFDTLARRCFSHGVAFSAVPHVLSEMPCKIASREICGWPVLELQVPRLHMAQILMKRWLDLTISLIGLALLAPVFVMIGLTIRFQSPGPVFFRQLRPGLGGRKFKMLKFRTMRVDAETSLRADPELYGKFLANDCKLPDGEDPRVLPIGAFLRRTSLDELPQMFNVLRGDMSLVGPRPIVGPEIEHYGPWAYTFLGVRPGITGPWQVEGRSRVLFPDRANIDLDYIINWSFLRDLWILIRTVPSVFMQRGAH